MSIRNFLLGKIMGLALQNIYLIKRKVGDSCLLKCPNTNIGQIHKWRGQLNIIVFVGVDRSSLLASISSRSFFEMREDLHKDERIIYWPLLMNSYIFYQILRLKVGKCSSWQTKGWQWRELICASVLEIYNLLN